MMRITAHFVVIFIVKYLSYNFVVAIDHPEDFVNLLAGMIPFYPIFAAKADKAWRSYFI